MAKKVAATEQSGIGFFERYLTVWVGLCMITGVALGQALPIVPDTLAKFEYAKVSIPTAVLIWQIGRAHV